MPEGTVRRRPVNQTAVSTGDGLWTLDRAVMAEGEVWCRITVGTELIFLRTGPLVRGITCCCFSPAVTRVQRSTRHLHYSHLYSQFGSMRCVLVCVGLTKTSCHDEPRCISESWGHMCFFFPTIRWQPTLGASFSRVQV